jgi:hypothetical protein
LGGEVLGRRDDNPLAIERMEYSDSLPGPYTIYPHENWKGAFDLGSYDVRTLNPPCGRTSSLRQNLPRELRLCWRMTSVRTLVRTGAGGSLEE